MAPLLWGDLWALYIHIQIAMTQSRDVAMVTDLWRVLAIIDSKPNAMKAIYFHERIMSFITVH